MGSQLITNEEIRIAALDSYDILYTLPEDAYNDIVQIAAHICGAPIAAISLVSSD